MLLRFYYSSTSAKAKSAEDKTDDAGAASGGSGAAGKNLSSAEVAAMVKSRAEEAVRKAEEAKKQKLMEEEAERKWHRHIATADRVTANLLKALHSASIVVRESSSSSPSASQQPEDSKAAAATAAGGDGTNTWRLQLGGQPPEKHIQQPTISNSPTASGSDSNKEHHTTSFPSSKITSTLTTDNKLLTPSYTKVPPSELAKTASTKLIVPPPGTTYTHLPKLNTKAPLPP